MTATRIIEEERGTFTGTPRNPHQGYYAGDFSGWPFTVIAVAPRRAERASSTQTAFRCS